MALLNPSLNSHTDAMNENLRQSRIFDASFAAQWRGDCGLRSRSAGSVGRVKVAGGDLGESWKEANGVITVTVSCIVDEACRETESGNELKASMAFGETEKNASQRRGLMTISWHSSRRVDTQLQRETLLQSSNPRTTRNRSIRPLFEFGARPVCTANPKTISLYDRLHDCCSRVDGRTQIKYR